MGVDAKHKQYESSLKLWKRCRDACAGEDAIKAAGDEYLPQLSGQDKVEYEAYKTRALFYNATRRTKQALVGGVFRKPPVIDPPSPYIEQRSREVLGEVIEVGRVGMLADVPTAEAIASGVAPEPYVAVYLAEDIINWRYRVVGDKKVLTQVVLRERLKTPKADDEFGEDEKTVYRVLDIDPVSHAYRQRLFVETTGADGKATGYQAQGDIFPVMRGQRLAVIPFKMVSAENLEPDVDAPPLTDLISVNLSHYRSSADLEHGRHFTALPTAWAAGFSTDAELTIGSGTAWTTDNVSAKCGFLEFTGAGLGALETALSSKEHLMAVLGARLFENQKAGVEAAETVHLRQSADTATASGIARLVSEAMTEMYQWMLAFSLTPAGPTAKVELNTDLLDTSMDGATLTALVMAWQSGAISQDTLLWNIKTGELLPPDVSVDDERALIEAEQANIIARYAAAGLDPSGAPTSGGAA